MAPHETGQGDSCLHAIVKGMVQGVNFRYYTRVQAQTLGLKGWVCNRPDGTVELVAEGRREALQSLLAFLRKGPPAAQVDDVEVEWMEPSGDFQSFQVRYFG